MSTRTSRHAAFVGAVFLSVLAVAGLGSFITLEIIACWTHGSDSGRVAGTGGIAFFVGLFSLLGAIGAWSEA